MGDLLLVLGLALLPPAGNFAGGMIAEYWKPSARLLNWSLHAASGIVLAIVSIELLPRALQGLAGWWIAAAFAGGGAAYLLIESSVQRLQNGGGSNDESGRTRMWMIYVAVAIDLSSDGLMLGTGSAVSASLGIVLALGQVLADVPEGYATIANFRDKGVPRVRRLLLSASFAFFSVGAALLAYLILRNVSEPVQMAALVFVAGLLTVAAVEDMLEEAHEARGDTRSSILAFVGGFALFTLVSAGFETVIAQDGGDQSGAGGSDSRQTRSKGEHSPVPSGENPAARQSGARLNTGALQRPQMHDI